MTSSRAWAINALECNKTAAVGTAYACVSGDVDVDVDGDADAMAMAVASSTFGQMLWQSIRRCSQLAAGWQLVSRPPSDPPASRMSYES